MSQSGASYPSIEVLLDMSRDMVGLLGVIAAILIAVITSIYALGEQKREAGYLPFLQALNAFRRLPDEIQRSREAIDPGNVGGAFQWAELAMQFIERMNLVPPAWRGYDEDIGLDPAMQQYVEASFAAKVEILATLDDDSDGIREVMGLSGYEQESLTGMVTGLYAMDSGIVMKGFATSLTGLSISLTILLILALAVRTLLGVNEPIPFALVAWLRPFVYLFFPVTVIVHILGILCAAGVWQGAKLARAKAWETELATPESV